MDGGSGGVGWTGCGRMDCGSSVFAGGCGCDDSGCGKPKNKFGMSAGGRAAGCVRPAAFCRVKNNGATTLKGSSNSMLSWTDAAGGVGLIKGRKFRHVKVMRPRFNAGSITFIGSKTWALARSDCMISSRNPSGHCSESAFSGAKIAFDSADTWAAGAAAGGNGAAAGGAGAIGAIGVTGGTGTKGFAMPLPLLRGVPKLFMCEVSCAVMDGGGGVVTLAAGALARGTNTGGGGATGGG
jgi:hypothetical protein